MLQTNGLSHGLKTNPNIQPDWRWQTAAQSFQNGMVADSNDPWIKQVEALVWSLQPQVGLKELPPQFHSVATAFQIYAQDSLIRDVLEARILAQQTDAEISAKCGIPADAVAAYAAVFWDVRGPGRKQVWMAWQFCGATSPNEFKAGLGDALKLRAFFRGSPSLEQMIHELSKLSGSTIAACTSNDCPEDELLTRYELAVSLLRRSQQKMLRRQFIHDTFMLGRKLPIQPTDAWNVLRRAKLSKKLRGEIKQLAERQEKITSPPINALAGEGSETG